MNTFFSNSELFGDNGPDCGVFTPAPDDGRNRGRVEVHTVAPMGEPAPPGAFPQTRFDGYGNREAGPETHFKVGFLLFH